MRIDCSKTLNYATERDRMCNYYADNGWCDACPMDEVRDCHNAEKITQEHIDILQKWSDEHPQETMFEYVKKMLPNIMLGENGLPKMCPHYLGFERINRCGSTKCEECWNRPYKD